MNTLEQLIKRRGILLAELQTLGDLVAGSFFEREVNGIKRYCLSKMVGKKQRQIYVSETHKDSVQQGVLHYHRIVELIKELGEINLTLTQNGIDITND